MSRTLTSPNSGSTVADTLKIHEGGTGATTAVQAAATLNAVSLSQVGQPGGVAELDALGKLPAAALPSSGVTTINVIGPINAAAGQVNTYTISNYDVFSEYVVAAVRGAVYRTGKVIVYTAPSTEGDGVGGFVINGRVFNVNIGPSKPVVPILVGTSTAGSVAGTAALVGSGTAFAMMAGANTHLNTDWQVASDAAFTAIVAESLADAVKKVTWSSGNLSLSTVYYMRCCYRDSSGAVSDWSNTVTITTRAVYTVNVETAKLTANDRAAGDYFGSSVSMDSTGTRMVVGSRYTDLPGASNAGAAYIFVRTGATWTQEAKLSAGDVQAAAYFGMNVSMDSGGARAAVSANFADSAAGAVYVYIRTGVTWTQEAKLSASDATSNRDFGTGIGIDSTGARVVVTSDQASVGALYYAGAAYIFVRSGVTWTQEAKLSASDATSNAYFGNSVSMDSTGVRIAVGSSGGVGAVYIYTRTGTTWTQEAKLTATDAVANDNLGTGVSIDSAGTRVAAGAASVNAGGRSDTGAVYIFVRSGVTWTQETRLIATNPSLSYDILGTSVSIDSAGTRVAAGAPGTDYSAGTVLIFVRSGTAWTQETKLSASDAQASDYFGTSVSIDSDGTRVATGADRADISAMSNVGAVYVFTP